MNEQEFRELLKKQQQGKLTKNEELLLGIFEGKLLNTNKDLVFKDDHHRRKIKEDIFFNISQSKKSRFKSRFIPIAASIVLLISVSIGSYFYTHSDIKIESTAIIKNITKETLWGQKMSVTLPDGSTVKLNVGSKLTFPETFSDSLRLVKLEGEAFFDVVKNPDKPFIIQSGDLKTTVFGTTFNIDAYSDEKDIKVTLATGKVSIEVDGKKAMLIPSEQVIFNKKEGEIITRKVNVNRYLDWKNGVLHFENVSLGEAANKLEKWYNVVIEFENEDLKKCMFTGTFKNEELTTVLESIIFVKQHMSYDIISNNKIILKGNCTN